MTVDLQVERLVKLDNAVNAIRIFKFEPDSGTVQIVGVDLKIIGIIRTDRDALLGKELGPFFGADRDVDDNAVCY